MISLHSSRSLMSGLSLMKVALSSGWIVCPRKNALFRIFLYITQTSISLTILVYISKDIKNVSEKAAVTMAGKITSEAFLNSLYKNKRFMGHNAHFGNKSLNYYQISYRVSNRKYLDD